jgi:hypothetical protein
MGRFFKSVKEHAMREHSMFPGMVCGPLRGRCHDDGVTVETAHGLTVSLPISTTIDMRYDRELLRNGVPVSVNGEVVAHLVQPSHGLRRKNRAMQLIGVDPARYPDGAHFRLRGSGNVTLEDGRRRLAGYRPVILRPYVQPEVSCELAAVFMAVSIGLYIPLYQSVADRFQP